MAADELSISRYYIYQSVPLWTGISSSVDISHNIQQYFAVLWAGRAIAEVQEGQPRPPGCPDTWHHRLCDISLFETVSRWLREVGSHRDEPTATGLQLPHTHNSCEPAAGQNLGPFKWRLLVLPSQKGQKLVYFTPHRTSPISAGFHACGEITYL